MRKSKHHGEIPAQVPAEIPEYIYRHFDGAFLSKITSVSDQQNNTTYHANISCDHVRYYLTFNGNGQLVYTIAEPHEEILDEENYVWYGDDDQHLV